MESCGKNCARATPICAFAAIELRSACWMSGRRSSSCEGRPVGRSCGGGVSAFGIGMRDGPGILRRAKDGAHFPAAESAARAAESAMTRCREVARPGARRRAGRIRRSRVWRQIDGFLPSLECLLRDLKLAVERAQLDIGGRDLLRPASCGPRAAPRSAPATARGRLRSVCDKGPRNQASTQRKG